MTKKILLILISLFFFISCNKKDNTKNIGNISLEKKGNLLGAVDKNGNKILDIKYNDIDTINNKFIKASINSSYGVFDLKGNEIVPIVATDILKVFDSKYFLVQIGKYKCIFDLEGNKLIDEHDEFYTYSKGIVTMSKKVIVNNIDLENRFFVYDLEKSNSKLNTKKGYRKFIELLNPFDNKKNFLFRTNKNYVFDISNKQIKQFSKYYKVGKYGEELLIVYDKDHIKGYSDTKGDLKFDFVFVVAEPFENGKAKVSIDGNQEFIINKNGDCTENCPSKKLLKYKNIKDWKKF